MCMFQELGHEGSCCQNTISSSKQQLHFSGCPNPCSHPTTANSHHWCPSLTLLPHSQGLLFFCRSLTHILRPLVLYPLHHLHHFVFLQCMFLRWLSRPEAQGSGIVSLFCWDILMRLNIFSILFQPPSPPPSYFLAHFIYCLFVLILILILYMFLSQYSLFLYASPNLLAVSATCSPVYLFSFIRTDLLLWLSDTFSRCTAQCN